MILHPVVRKFRIDGERKVIRIDAEFWRALEEISSRSEIPLRDLLAELHRRYEKDNAGTQNFASAIRIFCISYHRVALNASGYSNPMGIEGIFKGTPFEEDEEVKN
jgi:predicted DNA-binding ribbon-helix-helix protein